MNLPPFRFTRRALSFLPNDIGMAEATEQRDVELEDYLVRLERRIAALEAAP